MNEEIIAVSKLNYDNSLQKRLYNLDSRIKYNKNEIDKLNKKSTKEEINKVDKYFYDNLKELNDLIEMLSLLKEYSKEKSYMNNLESLYKEVQNNYLNKKIEIIDEKISIVNESVNNSIEQVKENTNNITGNILFSLISIVLGISLVSAMTNAITNMNEKYYLAYYTTIAWVAVLVLGFSYLLLRSYDKKSKCILLVIGIVTIMLLVIFYITFIK